MSIKELEIIALEIVASVSAIITAIIGAYYGIKALIKKYKNSKGKN